MLGLQTLKNEFSKGNKRKSKVKLMYQLRAMNIYKNFYGQKAIFLKRNRLLKHVILSLLIMIKKLRKNIELPFALVDQNY